MFQASLLYFYPRKYLGHFMCMIYRYPQHTRHAPDYNVISDLYLQVIHLAKNIIIIIIFSLLYYMCHSDCTM